MKIMSKKIKPSELFEGENSSLRKTFDEATKKQNWAMYCAIHECRNQCSDENCTIFPACLFKKTEQQRFKQLIVEEINICRAEGQPTSRLISLYNK